MYYYVHMHIVQQLQLLWLVAYANIALVKQTIISRVYKPMLTITRLTLFSCPAIYVQAWKLRLNIRRDIRA